MIRYFILILFVLCFNLNSNSQEIKEIKSVIEGSFEPSKDTELESVVEILQGDFPIGRGTLVKKEGENGVVITAYHVLFPSKASLKDEKGNDITIEQPIHVNHFKVKYKNGAVRDRGIFMYGKESSDWALIYVTVPNDVKPVEIGVFDSNSKIYTYDINWKNTVVIFKYSANKNDILLFDHTPITGESGGPIFSNGKLIGVVSGGYHWLDKQPVKDRLMTWPLRAAHIRQDFIKK